MKKSLICKPTGSQLFFEFENELLEKEQKALELKRQEAINALAFYENATSDNEVLFNLQRDYYINGNEKALKGMFTRLNQIAEKLVRKECREHKVFYTKARQEEVAVDATALVIEQIIKNELKIQTSFVAYLYLQIRKVMYDRTKAQKLEDYCRKYNIDFFALGESEKLLIKAEVESMKDDCIPEQATQNEEQEPEDEEENLVRMDW